MNSKNNKLMHYLCSCFRNLITTVTTTEVNKM